MLVTQEYSVAGSRSAWAVWTLVCRSIVMPLSRLTGPTSSCTTTSGTACFGSTRWRSSPTGSGGQASSMSRCGRCPAGSGGSCTRSEPACRRDRTTGARVSARPDQGWVAGRPGDPGVTDRGPASRALRSPPGRRPARPVRGSWWSAVGSPASPPRPHSPSAASRSRCWSLASTRWPGRRLAGGRPERRPDRADDEPRLPRLLPPVLQPAGAAPSGRPGAGATGRPIEDYPLISGAGGRATRSPACRGRRR